MLSDYPFLKSDNSSNHFFKSFPDSKLHFFLILYFLISIVFKLTDSMSEISLLENHSEKTFLKN